MGSHVRSSLFPLFLLLTSLLSTQAPAKNTSFDFTSFSFLNLTLLGDSYLRNRSVGLTRETIVPSSSSGTAICNLPIQFYDPRENISASFSTKFSFSITNPNPESYGDGLTFFMSPGNGTLGSTGGYLGLFNSISAINNVSIISIEFDTRLDAGFNDSSDNHVGFDINSPISVKAEDLSPHGIELKSGNLITAWIDYHNDESMLKIWLGNSSDKPENPVMFMKYDLSKHFLEYMYVGFSAATEGSTEVHTIEGWSFQTFGFTTPNLSSHVPYNMSDSSWSKIPTIPVTGPQGSSHKKLSLSLAIIGPVALSTAFVMFVWISVTKWMELKASKEGLKSDLLKGPRKFRYRELSSATRGFHRSRIVGNGAFGMVYKAVHPGSGITYAVKRSKQAQQSQKEFIAELSIIACLRHKNLVQLEGWCTEKDELLLVYEFMPNGSLDKALYCRPESMLKWSQRYNVATGIASVLTYLHQGCEQQVIHRDIKTSNIMLDANFNPRLGDFGLARLHPEACNEKGSSDSQLRGRAHSCA
ncbi:Protein kinase domain [Cocos nucifera]|uniref:non-specific serine/threonine protein kinase n=1 Tax=Cocos nucifera TaxID=13894 RepID=A0A8K0HWE3_COCNU|nr:Protein kinase domain [Cocos nucifera]